MILTFLAAWLCTVLFLWEFGSETWLVLMLSVNVFILLVFTALAVVNQNGDQKLGERFELMLSIIFNSRPVLGSTSTSLSEEQSRLEEFEFYSPKLSHTLEFNKNHSAQIAVQHSKAQEEKPSFNKSLSHCEEPLHIRMDSKGRIINVSDEVAYFHNTSKKKLKRYTKDDLHERLSLDNPNWYIQVLENHQSHASGMTRLEGETVKIFWLFKAMTDDDNRLKGIEAHGRKTTAFFERSKPTCKTQPDELTGLMTLKGLHEKLETLNLPRKACAYVLDVDGFSNINDYYGHGFGDKVIQKVSDHLKNLSGPKTLISRVSADQFVLLHMEDSEDGLASKAESINLPCQMNLTIDGTELLINLKIGYAEYPEHAPRLEALVAKAELALKRSHFTNPYGFVSYQESFGDDLKKRMHISQRLKEAIREDKLDIHFQKIYDVRTDDATSVEALVRWTDPIYGRVTPREIFEIAESSGMTIMLEKMLVIKAVGAYKDLKTLGAYEDTALALNLAPASLLDKTFLPYLEDVIHKNGLTPGEITIEISEKIFMNALEMCLERISAYKAEGFKIAIDDFGKEFSSLSVLERIDFDIIKIDALFVKNIAIKKNQEIFRMVRRITENTRQSFIVEGVETKDQKHILEALGCFYQQGFLHHYPRPLK